ncbi:hypothetical protein KS4_17490 [Poriferisphaera corsica]|uniref:STAS domain-containing protein n=1 Tax=Poriferisphaera corsica TaxID=2528020 RepID=A0A517YTY7_9BACT|nr:STAS domain-containing protein [Poriferisphaera corsica]QDU33693.1 hypothetical protein KS4_17490 [Poriferisphaera corsica]
MPIQHWSDTIWILALEDDPDFTEEVQSLQVELTRLIKLPNLIIDLSELTTINSSNLSLLLRLRKQLIDADAKLRVVSPIDAIWAVMISTSLDKVFNFTENSALALAELQLLEQ